MRDGDIAGAVRRAVLQNRAAGYGRVHLSQLVWQVMRDPAVRCAATIKSCKALRGRVQAHLAKLAQQGVMYTRRRPEPRVLRYEHGEIDKSFRIRISVERAIEMLGE